MVVKQGANLISRGMSGMIIYSGDLELMLYKSDVIISM
jgi:hypothetical protein